MAEFRNQMTEDSESRILSLKFAVEAKTSLDFKENTPLARAEEILEVARAFEEYLACEFIAQEQENQ